jgi:hypothetical protein
MVTTAALALAAAPKGFLVAAVGVAVHRTRQAKDVGGDECSQVPCPRGSIRSRHSPESDRILPGFAILAPWREIFGFKIMSMPQLGFL